MRGAQPDEASQTEPRIPSDGHRRDQRPRDRPDGVATRRDRVDDREVGAGLPVGIEPLASRGRVAHECHRADQVLGNIVGPPRRVRRGGSPASASSPIERELPARTPGTTRTRPPPSCSARTHSSSLAPRLARTYTATVTSVGIASGRRRSLLASLAQLRRGRARACTSSAGRRRRPLPPARIARGPSAEIQIGTGSSGTRERRERPSVRLDRHRPRAAGGASRRARGGGRARPARPGRYRCRAPACPTIAPARWRRPSPSAIGVRDDIGMMPVPKRSTSVSPASAPERDERVPLPADLREGTPRRSRALLLRAPDWTNSGHGKASRNANAVPRSRGCRGSVTLPWCHAMEARHLLDRGRRPPGRRAPAARRSRRAAPRRSAIRTLATAAARTTRSCGRSATSWPTGASPSCPSTSAA